MAATASGKRIGTLRAEGNRRLVVGFRLTVSRVDSACEAGSVGAQPALSRPILRPGVSPGSLHIKKGVSDYASNEGVHSQEG